MKSYAVFLSTLGLLLITSFAQEPGPADFSLRLLEHDLLTTPCFGRPFYDALAESLDDPAWKNLDTRWAKLQSSAPRHALLRGMLAEQQGNFDSALSHYASLPEDDWAAYHLARLHAFLGRTDDAKKELLAVTATTKHPWLFREAARGLGELILLQEGVPAAEKHYADLWERHPALEHRMALIEPLLALRTDLGRGAAWLDTMRPAFDPKADFAPSTAEIDRGILWHWGSQLTQPQLQRRRAPVPQQVDDSVLYGDLLYAGMKDEWFAAALQHPDCARWAGPLTQEQGFFPLTKSPQVMAESLMRQPNISVEALASLLSLAANDGGEVFLQTAKILKPHLHERPWLALRTALLKTDRIHSAHDRLRTEVFEGVTHPAWQFISLILRRQAGAKPDQLRADAIALWQSVNPGQRLHSREGGPHELYGTLRKSILEPLTGESFKQSPWCPSFSVTWNLRGTGFTAVMRNRFAFETQRLFSVGATSVVLSLPPKSKDGKWYLGSLPEIETGLQLRFLLWLLRDDLGLDQQNLALPAPEKQDPASLALDVLARGTHEDICRFVIAAPDLSSLPAKSLLALRKTLLFRQSAQTDPKATAEIYEAATTKLADALLTQRPGWAVTSLLLNRPLPKAAELDVAQCDDLLIACSRSLEKQTQVSITELQNWRQLIPAITDDASLRYEHSEAIRRLGLKALPHALWGLQWQPSLRRQVVLASPDYTGPRTHRRYLPYLQESLPKIAQKNPMLPFTMSIQSLGPDVDEVSFKLMALFGPELMEPQFNRIPDIAASSAQHPRMKDLLTAWNIMKEVLPQDELPQYYRFVHPVKQAAILKVLEASPSSDARLTLAVLHQSYGDPQVAERLLAENNGPQGPLHILASMAAQRASTIPPADPGALDRAKKIFADLKEPEPIRTLAFRMGKTQAERQTVYDWLRKEVKPEPAFAIKISVLAELARTLKLPDQEIASAEQLDLQLHLDDPYRWISRGITQARAGDESQALDSFFGAVRCMKFAAAPTFRWEQAPPKTPWLERTAQAGRMNDLSAALLTAIENNPPGSAGEAVTLLLQSILKADAPAATQPLLDQLLARDRHILLALYDSLSTAATEAEKAGHHDRAVFLARMSLRGIWPKSIARELNQTETLINGAPRGVYNAGKSWGIDRDSEDVAEEAPIAFLLQLALSGPDAADFSAELLQSAAQFPEEEQLISCALVAVARQHPLKADELKLMEKLPPYSRMRVAWRLCVHASSSHVPTLALAPSLAAGLQEIFEHPQHQRAFMRHYELAGKVIPLLEQAGAKTELAALVTLFSSKLNDEMYPLCWRYTAGLAAKYAAPQFSTEFNLRWWDHCFRKTSRSSLPVEWNIETMDEIGLLIQDPSNPTPEPFADLANELWRVTLRKFAATKEDPPAEMARVLCDALVATGRIDQLKTLLVDTETILKTDGDEQFSHLRDRIQQGIKLLGTDGKGMPSPQISLKDSTLSWRLTMNLKTPGMEDTWVVPHFMKGAHELEIFAGETPEALRPVAKLTIKNKAGTLPLQNLPTSGWLRAVLRNPATGLSNFGKSLLFCLSKPLLDSTALDSAHPPEWDEEVLKQFGRPISTPVPIDPSMRFLITGNDGLFVVALDDSGDPIGFLPSTALLEPEMWLDSEGRMKGANARPTHLVMTTFAESDTQLPPFILQIFGQIGHPAVPDEPQILSATPVATLDFPILRWRLNAKHPRATFIGNGSLTLFNTTTSPWKPLLHYSDGQLGRSTGIYVLQPDAAWLLILPQDNKQTTCELRQLRCDGTPNPVTLRECPSQTLPFIPLHTSISPDEKSLVFISPITQGELQVAWLDASLKLLKIKAPRQSSAPVVVSWSDNHTALIQQSGALYQVRDGLKLEPTSTSTAPAPAPDLAWTLKRPQIMVQTDRKTGDVMQTFRLPEQCIGQPMTWKSSGSPILLQTSQHELIIVKPKVP